MSDSIILDVADQILDMIISNNISIDQLNQIYDLSKLLENHTVLPLDNTPFNNIEPNKYVSEFEKAIQDKTELDEITYRELYKTYFVPMKELMNQSKMSKLTYKKLLNKLTYMYDTYSYKVLSKETPQNINKMRREIIKMNKEYKKLTDEDKIKLPPPPQNMNLPNVLPDNHVVDNLDDNEPIKRPLKRPSNKPSNEKYTRKKEIYNTNIDPLPTFDTLMKKMDEIIRTKLNTRPEDIKPFIDAINDMTLTEEQTKQLRSKLMYIFMKDSYLDTKKLEGNTNYVNTLYKNTVDAYNKLSDQDKTLFEKIHTNLSTDSEDKQPDIKPPTESFDTYVKRLEQHIYRKTGLDEAEYKLIVKTYLNPMEILSKTNAEKKQKQIYESKRNKITYMYWLNRYNFLVKNDIKVESVIIDTLNYSYNKLMDSDKENLQKPPNILSPESSPNNKSTANTQQKTNSLPNTSGEENIKEPMSNQNKSSNTNYGDNISQNYIDRMRQETNALRSIEESEIPPNNFENYETYTSALTGIENIEKNVNSYRQIMKKIK